MKKYHKSFSELYSHSLRSLLFSYKITLQKIILQIEYYLILLVYKININDCRKQSPLKHDIFFVEKSYQGVFRNSNKNDHYKLSRQSLLNHTRLNIGVYPFDSLNLRLKRYLNTLRFLTKIKRQKSNPDVIMYFSIQSLIYFNPMIFKKLRREGFKCLAILTDGAWSGNKIITKKYAECFDFVSCWDDPFFPNLDKYKVIKGSFSPFPKSIHHSPSYKRNLDISFVGKVQGRPDREKFITFLRESPLKFAIHTEKEGYVTSCDYYKIIKNSKIIINNSLSKNRNEITNQMKGRVFEALLSGNLLFENKNKLTSNFFVPGKHYIEYSDFSELKFLLKYHLEHFETVGYKIAMNGHLMASTKFTGSEYWKIILNELKNAKKN